MENLLSKKYRGEDIFVAYGDYVLLIAEGTGDNLLPEDESEGFVDYFNLEVYKREEFNEKDSRAREIGGGFMMREHLIADEFYGKTVKEIVDMVVENSGEDDFGELYVTSTPKYEILRIGD